MLENKTHCSDCKYLNITDNPCHHCIDGKLFSPTTRANKKTIYQRAQELRRIANARVDERV